MGASVNKKDSIFFNHSFDKKRLKALISWVFKQSGEAEALKVVDLLKETGFRHATKAGISIGLHDLSTPIQKSSLISDSQLAMNTTERDFVGARITATERSQRIVDTWHRASEGLSKQVVDYFGVYDRFNPVYIMALSGARGNFSQVRQLIGMRGLMADQQGKIVNFPIRSNLREGLTLTEYFISCSGARKGLVDTALRTADTGYLTRRLVDVSHHVVVKRVRCNTNRGIAFTSLHSYNKVLLPLKERLVGRVLAEDLALPAAPARRDQEISLRLASEIAKARDRVLLRSPLTCGFTHSVCQLCYGWSISQGSLVSLGDAVGVIAAQSIGEPGTQLTMRTFHTGGVFSGDLLQEIRSPHAGKISFSKAFQGLLIRTAHGRVAFLSKAQGSLVLSHAPGEERELRGSSTTVPVPAFTMLFVRQGETVEKNQLLAEFSIRTKEGNQPIKTEQTVFAQLSGRVVEERSGKVYTRPIKESSLLLHPYEGQAVPSLTDTLQGLPLPYKAELCNPFWQGQEQGGSLRRAVNTAAQKQGALPQTSSWTYKGKLDTLDPRVPQVIASFSSYNGYISPKKISDRGGVALVVSPPPQKKATLFARRTSRRFACKTRSTSVQAYRRTGAQAHRRTGVQAYRRTGVQLKGLYPCLASKTRTYGPCHTKGLTKGEIKGLTKGGPLQIYVRKGVPVRHKQDKNVRALSHQRWPFTNLRPYPYPKGYGYGYKASYNYKYKYKASLCKKLMPFTNRRFVRHKEICKKICRCRFVWHKQDKSVRTLTKAPLCTARAYKAELFCTATAYKAEFCTARGYKAPLCTARAQQMRTTPSSTLLASACAAWDSAASSAKKPEPRFVRKMTPHCTQNLGLSTQPLKGFNVPHGVQDETLQKAFNRRLSRWNTPFCRTTPLTTLCPKGTTAKNQSSVFRAQAFSSHRHEDLESDAFRYIEPVLSGRLGFLKILSVRVGATLDYISPTSDHRLKKGRGLRTQGVLVPLTKEGFEAKYLHPESIKENRFFLQTVAEYGDLVEEGYSYNSCDLALPNGTYKHKALTNP